MSYESGHKSGDFTSKPELGAKETIDDGRTDAGEVLANIDRDYDGLREVT